ncbi:MAG: acetoacetate decarboxylase family protein [Candidatus Thorarchaeota archaeon]|nr:acetoacetate decarboxylase family protein [Candidatus Thorarchaeota archaeon]
MERGYSVPLSSPLYSRPPYHYDGAKIFLALFYASEDTVRELLPPPLKPSDMRLMGVMFGEQPCRETGRFMESGVLIQCLYPNPDTGQDEVGVYFSHNYGDTDVSLVSGREIWGYPRKLGVTTMEWSGDTLEAKTVRDGITVLRAKCTFNEDGEWIDSGPNINVKMIPSVDGKGHDIAAITAAHLTYDVKAGRSGEVEIELRSGPHDDLSMIEIESTMIGLFFETDIVVPPGRVVARLDAHTS